jgi:hypothetical protein
MIQKLWKKMNYVCICRLIEPNTFEKRSSLRGWGVGGSYTCEYLRDIMNQWPSSETNSSLN